MRVAVEEAGTRGFRERRNRKVREGFAKGAEKRFTTKDTKVHEGIGADERRLVLSGDAGCAEGSVNKGTVEKNVTAEYAKDSRRARRRDLPPRTLRYTKELGLTGAC